MLSPKYMQKLPNELLDHFEDLETLVLKDLAKRIKKTKTINYDSQEQIKAMINLGYDLEDLKKEISKATNIGLKKLDKAIEKAGLDSYENDLKAYLAGGKNLPPYEASYDVRNMVKAIKKISKEDLRNITGTLGLDGRPLEEYYRDTLSKAVIQVNSGAFSADDVITRVINDVSERGLQTISYKSGRNYTIEGAVRASISTAVNRLSGEMSLLNAKDMDQDLMELTAHAGARPSHQEWQGQVVSLSGDPNYLSTNDIGYGDDGGFMGANCRHNWYPFFEGASIRAWTDEELKEIDPPDFSYNDRNYTYYEATQRQRQIERSIRKSKRKIAMFEETGIKEEATKEKIKLQRKRQEYFKFSKAGGLPNNIHRS